MITQSGHEDEREAVAVMMSHSRQTQERYYAHIKSTRDPVKGYKLMEGLRKDASSRSPGKRVNFSDQEVEVIKLYFQSYIDSRKAPSTDDCREFLRQHQMARQAKQVRDKVRYLIRRKEVDEDEKEEEH